MARDDSFNTLRRAKLVAVMLVTAALGFCFTHVYAQSVDSLVDEAIQILTEKHEIVHLTTIGQLDGVQAQEKLQANKQRWENLSRKVRQQPPEQQRAFMEQFTKRKIALQQKFGAEARQLQKEGSAQVGQEPAVPMTSAAEGKNDSASSSAAHALKSNDVMGIAIGMSVTEVKKLLNDKFPSNSNFPIDFDSYGKQWIGQYVSLPAWMIKKNNVFDKKANEVVAIDFSNPPLKQEVLAVAKFQSYPNDKTPSLSATETGLIEKYGQWDKKDERGATIYYFWGRNPSCIPIQLLEVIDLCCRLKELVRGDSSQSVICQAYGVWGQCLKPVSDIIKPDPSFK